MAVNKTFLMDLNNSTVACLSRKLPDSINNPQTLLSEGIISSEKSSSKDECKKLELLNTGPVLCSLTAVCLCQPNRAL